jgi:hypothetical protein
MPRQRDNARPAMPITAWTLHIPKRYADCVRCKPLEHMIGHQLLGSIVSAIPPKADMCGAAKDVRFGPKADMAAFSLIVPALQFHAEPL